MKLKYIYIYSSTLFFHKNHLKSFERLHAEVHEKEEGRIIFTLSTTSISEREERNRLIKINMTLKSKKSMLRTIA